MDKKRENSRIKKALASITAMKHGRPGKKLNLIVIAGEYGKTTTAQLLRGVLIEAGKKVAEMTASRFDEADFQNDLRALQKNLRTAHFSYKVRQASQTMKRRFDKLTPYF